MEVGKGLAKEVGTDVEMKVDTEEGKYIWYWTWK